MELKKAGNENWTTVISPSGGVFDFKLKELWHYRDLLTLMVRRDFVSQYKQTILGSLWHLIQPIFTTIVFLLLFSRIANIPTDGIPPVLFYMSGIALWNYFSTCFTSTSTTFITNAGIFGKVYFPRLIVPLSVVCSNIVKFGIQFFLVVVVMVYYHFNGYPIRLDISMLLIPFLLIVMAGLGLGMGIIISSLTAKYRDFNVLVTFGVQLLMYATPVAYPLSYIDDGKLKSILLYNPMSPLIETFRYALFGHGTFDLMFLLYSTVFMIVVVFLGLIIFNKVEGSFMDTV